MVEKCGSDVGGEMVVAAPTSAEHPHQLGGACLAPGPSPVHLLQVAESTGNQMATPRALVEGFAVLEPPVDAEAAAERADDVAALLAAFGNHLHERTAHHLGRHPYGPYASPAHERCASASAPIRCRVEPVYLIYSNTNFSTERFLSKKKQRNF
jgi:hypothetical protein